MKKPAPGRPQLVQGARTYLEMEKELARYMRLCNSAELREIVLREQVKKLRRQLAGVLRAVAKAVG